MMRLFIGWAPSEGFRSLWAEALLRLPQRPGLRWVRPPGLHLTLRFLGSTPSERIPALSRRLEEAAASQGPFNLRFGGVEGFPDLSHPKVLALTCVEGGGEAAKLAAAIDRVLEREGIPPEGRAYRPHLTMARCRTGSEGREAAGELEGALLASLPEEKLAGFLLFESRLSSQGPQYLPLGRFPLKG